MIFSDELLFLHVPKAGGTAIIQYLLDVLPGPVRYCAPRDHQLRSGAQVQRLDGVGHESLAEAAVVLERHGLSLEGMPLILATVRDPYALEVSRYSFLRQDLGSHNHGPQQALALTGSFERFATCSRPHGDRPLEIYFTRNGRVPPNLRVLRLEHIEHDLRAALLEIGVGGPASIEPQNTSAHDDFRGYYTAASEAAVYEKYKWIFGSGFYPRLESSGSPADEADPAEEKLASATGSGAEAFTAANACLAAAAVHGRAGRHEQRYQALELALDAARNVGSPRLVTRTVLEMLRCLALTGHKRCDEALARCEELIDAPWIGPAADAVSLVRAELVAAAGDLAQAHRACRELRAGTPELLLASASVAGGIELLNGAAQTAAGLLRQGRPWNQSDYAGDLADALYQDGQRSDARTVAAFAAATAPAADLVAGSRWRRVHAKLLLDAGEVSSAVGAVHEAVELGAGSGSAQVHADALLDLASVRARAGDGEGARAARLEAQRRYEEKGNAVRAGQIAQEAVAPALSRPEEARTRHP